MLSYKRVSSKVRKYFCLIAITLCTVSIIIAPQKQYYTIQAFQYELINTFGEWDVAQNDTNHLNQPRVLSVTQQYIIVDDWGNNRIVIFNRTTLELLYIFNGYSFDNGTKLKIGVPTTATIFNNKVVLYDYKYQTLFILELDGMINKMLYWPAERNEKTYLAAYVVPVNNDYLYIYTNSNDTAATTYWNITVFDSILTKLSSVALSNFIPEVEPLPWSQIYNVQSLENGTIFIYIYSDPSISCILSYDPVNSQWNANSYELEIHPLNSFYYSIYLNSFYSVFGCIRFYTPTGDFIGRIKALPNGKSLTGAMFAFTYKDILYTADYEHHVLLVIKITDLTPTVSTTTTHTDSNANTFVFYLVYILHYLVYYLFGNPFITFSVLFLILVLIGSLIALKIKKKRRKAKELEP